MLFPNDDLTTGLIESCAISATIPVPRPIRPKIKVLAIVKLTSPSFAADTRSVVDPGMLKNFSMTIDEAKAAINPVASEPANGYRAFLKTYLLNINHSE